MTYFSRTALGFGVVGCALLLNLSTGHAQAPLDKCEAKLDKAVTKWEAAASKALASCKAAMRKQTVAAAPNYVKAAAACEKALAKLYGKAEAKFEAGVDALFAGGTCDATSLAALGHLVSGGTGMAPGVSDQDWLKHWLVWSKYKLAIKDELFVDAHFFDQVATVKTGAGVNCSAGGTTSDPSVTVPNFCKLEINCRDVACTLTAASTTTASLGGGALTVLGIPVTGSTVFEACRVTDPFPFDLGYYYLVDEPAHTIKPINLLGNTVCVEEVKSEGWCNCTGAATAIPSSVSLCQDHNANSGATCSGTATGPNTAEGPCFCSSDGVHADGPQCGPGSSGPHFCSGAEGVCGRTLAGGFCHPGTTNSGVYELLSGSTPNGGCVDLKTIAFKTLPPGGNCGTGNPASFGPDCTPCTSDDLVPPAAALTIPFTTGTISAQVVDAQLASGNCSNSGDATTQCIEDANCTAASGDTCVGAIINPSETLPSVTGSPIDNTKPGCPDLEGGTLTGLKLVAAFPALDGAGLGDVVQEFSLVCQ